MSSLKIRVIPRFLAAIFDGVGTKSRKDGLATYIDLDYSRLVQTSQFDPTNTLFAIWNKFTGQWNTISPASFSSGSFQSAASASNTAADGTTLLAVQRAAPATTAITLPLLANQGGKSISIVDFSTSVTNHAITITPTGGATIMGQSSWKLYSTADQLGSLTLRPSLDLNSWVIAP
jgi:hypothetical protein